MKLSTKARIQDILDHGDRFQSGPLRFYRLSAEKPGDGAVTILVAKKRFPKSVDRNRIRRLIRESWRLRSKERRGSGKMNSDIVISVGHLDKKVEQEAMDRWVARFPLP